MENISTTVPTWQHPILPGQALQGNILVTKNDFKEPPQSQSNFEWVDIEDLCGVHDVKATVDTDKNIITLYKTGGHRNQDGTWVEDWIPYIEIQQLTKELVEILTNMLYIEYRFNIVNNDGDEDYSSINIQGVRKDGITIDDLGTFKTYSIKKLDEMFAESGASIEAEKTAREQADATLQTNIDKEKEDRNTEDDKLHTYLQQETTNRTNADKTLQDNIDSEKSSRETADTNLEKSLNSEKIDRAKADATLTTNLNTETTNRTTADTTLQTNIDNEKSARETAIKGLEDKIAKLPVSDSIYTKTETDALLLKKQDKLTAGDNITIDENNKISATGGGTTYTAGDNITIDSANKISAKDTTYSAGDNITIDSTNKISAKDTTYTAGDNITIDSSNKISAKDTTYTAGDNITIDANNKISATASSGISEIYPIKFLTGSGTDYAISSYEVVTLANSVGTALKINFNEKNTVGKKMIDILNSSETYSIFLYPRPELPTIGSSYVPSSIKECVNKDNTTYKDYQGLCISIGYIQSSGITLSGTINQGVVGKYDVSGNYYIPECKGRTIRITNDTSGTTDKCLLFFVQTSDANFVQPTENFAKMSIYNAWLEIKKLG